MKIKDSQIFSALSAKTDGKKKIKEAMKHYDLAFVAMYYQKEELNHLFSAKDKKDIVSSAWNASFGFRPSAECPSFNL